MFWHTSESQKYLIKNKSTKTRREIKIIHPDNYTSESQKYLIKNKSTKTRKEEKLFILITRCFDTLLNMKYTWI